MTLYLHAVGHAHPPNVISNRFLEQLDIGTTDEWILDRVGIRTRRTVLDLDYIRITRNRDLRAAQEASVCSGAELGARAAEMALRRAGLGRSEVGMVVAGSSAPETMAPGSAASVAEKLGLTVPVFDVASACTTVIVQLDLLSRMRREALPDFVLLVAPETVTCAVNYDDRATAVLWGDGAAAALVSPRVPGKARIVGTRFASDPSGADKVVVPRIGYFRQEGRLVQMFAIKKTETVYRELHAEFATPHRRFHLVGHQANLRMLENVCRRCAIPPELHHSNVEAYGNTGAAGSLSVLSMLWDSWHVNDDVALIGVGAGLTWGGCVVRFGSESEVENRPRAATFSRRSISDRALGDQEHRSDFSTSGRRGSARTASAARFPTGILPQRRTES